MIQPWLDALAFLVLAIQWPIPLFWLFVHPFKSFWIRQGNLVYKTLGPAVWLTVWVGLAVGHRWLLADRFSHRTMFWLVAAGLLAVDFYVLLRVERDLGWRILVGLPELRPAANIGRVIREGIYARVRHPRYLGMMLAYIAAACLTRAPRIFLLVGMGCVLAVVVSELEERELLSRQGEEYARYRARVPRFIPRWRASEGGGEELKRRST